MRWPDRRRRGRRDPRLDRLASLLERDGPGLVADDVGGEWEREGLGKGLEERLEGLKAAVPSKA